MFTNNWTPSRSKTEGQKGRDEQTFLRTMCIHITCVLCQMYVKRVIRRNKLVQRTEYSTPRHSNNKGLWLEVNCFLLSWYFVTENTTEMKQKWKLKCHKRVLIIWYVNMKQPNCIFWNTARAQYKYYSLKSIIHWNLMHIDKINIIHNAVPPIRILNCAKDPSYNFRIDL